MVKQFSLPKIFPYKEQVSRSIAWSHNFLFFNILLALFISSSYLYAAPNTHSFLSFTYLILAYLGHTAFICCIFYLLTFFWLSFWGNFRYYRIVCGILATLAHVVLLVDVKLYLYVKIHLGFSSLYLIFSNLDFKTGLNYNFLYIAVPIVIILELIFAKLSTRLLYKEKKRIKMRIASFFLLCSFIASHCLYIWADATNYEKITMLRTVLPAHYPMTAKSFLQSHNFIKVANNDRNTDININYPLKAIEVQDDDAQYNFIFLNFNNLSYKDINLNNTPKLINLMQQYTSYNYHFLPYENMWDNVFSAVYSLPTMYEGSIRKEGKMSVLVEEFLRQQYHNDIIVSHEETLNYQNISTITAMRRPNITITTTDKEALDTALTQIKDWKENKHYELTLFLSDLSFTKNDKQYRANLYKVDQYIYKLYKELENTQKLNNTIFIITSLSGNKQKYEQESIYNRDRQHVPFIVISGLDTFKQKVYKDISSHFDIAPSILEFALGTTTKSWYYAVGQNIFNQNNVKENFVLKNDDLLFISKYNTIVYTDEGTSYIEKDGNQYKIKPNLEDLIEAMQNINRFIE